MFCKSNKTQESENIDKAYEYAIFLLSLNLRTVGEIIGKMKVRGYAEPVIGKIIQQLKALKYLNDRQYAEVFLENLKTYRTLGYYGIKKKFMEKKFPQTLLQSILDEHYTLEEEEIVARRLLKKEGYEPKKKSDNEVRYTTYGEGGEDKQKQKLVNRLKSRGFRGEVISKLLF